MPTAPDDNDTPLLKIILYRKIDIYVKRDGILDENPPESVLSDSWSVHWNPKEQAQD